ncbi:MAG TPA: WD40 repeat domain-containing protein [Spirochaetota bacterium]|nr:WD40 repeat domain-containing protein [Spirochaetota bacterium]
MKKIILIISTVLLCTGTGIYVAGENKTESAELKKFEILCRDNREDADSIRLQIQNGHSNQVSSIAFSPDGRTIASGSWDNIFEFWDSKS